MENKNPLLQFANTASVYVDLPSLGKYYNEEDHILGIAPDRVPICSMNAKTEMGFNNPDALMGGEAIVNAITQTVIGEINPKKLLVMDVEALLLGAKLASGNREIEYEIECPECGKKGRHGKDIDTLLQQFNVPDDEFVYETKNGLKIYLMPLVWEDHVDITNIVFKQSTLITTAKKEDLSEEFKKRIMTEMLNLLLEIEMKTITYSIQKILIPNGDVITNRELIMEFVENLDKFTIDELSTRITHIRDDFGIDNSSVIVCNSCNHEWEHNSSRYDPTNFFSRPLAQQNSKTDQKSSES